MKITFRLLAAVLLLIHLTGCVVLAVADAAATVVTTAVKATAKGVGAVVNTVLPDDEEKKKDPSK